MQSSHSPEGGQQQQNDSSSSEQPRSYTAVKLVGDGSFGTVWLCDWHSPLPPGTPLSPMQCGAGARPEWVGKRLVAVKRMKRVWDKGWEEASKLKELESLRKIPPHPNIIPLYDAYLQPQTKELYFVFESMEGNLYQLTKSRKGRPLAGGLVASIFYQVISGLHHIHEAGYFHRDMKPENLLVTTVGLKDYLPVKRQLQQPTPTASSTSTPDISENPPASPSTSILSTPIRLETDVVVIVKLADFGLAREINSSPPYTEYVSTRWYRAPEVLLRSREYGPPVDIWALGTILAEVVNLKPLFPGASEVDQVYRICSLLGDPQRGYGKDERGRQRGGGDWDRGIKMAHGVGFGFPKIFPPPFMSLFADTVPETLIDCISDCLKYNPRNRISARRVLEHPYFTETIAQTGELAFTTPGLPATHQPIPYARYPTQHQHHHHHQQHSLPNLNGQHHTGSSSSLLLAQPQRSLPPSHTHSPQQLKPSFDLGSDPANRQLPPPIPSPNVGSSHSPSSTPSLYDSTGMGSSSTLVGGGVQRIRTSGASALVDQLRELDLPSNDLSSYGRRPPVSELGNAATNNYSFGGPPDRRASIQRWQEQSQSMATLPEILPSPYDDDLSMADGDALDPVGAAVPGHPNGSPSRSTTISAPKKKKWGGLGSVFGGGDSKLSLAPVEEHSSGGPAAAPGHNPLKRSPSIVSVGGAPQHESAALDPKAAQKEAKRQARELELAKRAAAEAAGKERARAVMQKRDRLMREQMEKASSGGGGVSSDVDWSSSLGKSPAKSSSQQQLQLQNQSQPQLPVSSFSSQTSFQSGGGASTSMLSTQSLGALSADGGGSHQLRASASAHQLPYGNNGGLTLQHDPLLMNSGGHRHKSRRRDFDDDHSTSSHDANSIKSRSASALTFASVDSDPGPRGSPRHNHSSGLGRHTSTSTSSLGSHSTPVLMYQHPKGSTSSVEHQLATDFRNQTNLHSSGSGSPGHPQQQFFQQHRQQQHPQHNDFGRKGLTLPSINGVSNGNGYGGHQQYMEHNINPMFQVAQPPEIHRKDQLSSNSPKVSLPGFHTLALVAGQHSNHSSNNPSGS